jgi:hypothetical protein
MHEYHFSLNEKYKNTHFALNEEQVGLLTYITLYLALLTPTHGEERVLSKRVNERERGGIGCASILAPSTSIYNAKTSS